MTAPGAVGRRKQPEAVRRALLDAAARLAEEQGFAAVTIQSVAQAAGVTKGGLFHHFTNKQALIEGMVADQLDQLDAAIDEQIAGDPVPHGCFTRAYVEATLDQGRFGPDSMWRTMAATVIADPTARALWNTWLAQRLDRHRDTDGGIALEAVRLAADGAWLSTLMGGSPSPAVRSHLLSLVHASSVKGGSR